MAENVKTDQIPDLNMLVARGRALRNKTICDTCSHLIARLRKPFLKT